MHVANRFRHVSSSLINNRKPLSDRLFFKTGRFPVQFIRHFGLRKPKEPKSKIDFISKGPKKEVTSPFLSKAIKRHDLQKELKICYDIPSAKAASVTDAKSSPKISEGSYLKNKIAASNGPPSKVIKSLKSSESQKFYYKSLTALYNKRNGLSTSDNFLDEFSACVSKIMSQSNISNYKFSLNTILSVFQDCHIKKDYPQQFYRILKSIILPKLLTLSKESKFTTSDFVFLLNWMRKGEIYFSSDAVENKEMAQLFLRAIVQLKHENTESFAINFSFITYCALKLNVNCQLLDKEEFLQAILSCSETALAEPSLDVRLTTTIFYSLMGLFKIKQYGSPSLAKIALRWCQKVMDLVSYELSNADISKKNALANTIVNCVEALHDIMVNIDNFVDEKSKKEAFASIFPALCVISIVSIPHLNEDGPGMFRMIDSFEAMDLRWERFPLELKNIFRKCFLRQLSENSPKTFFFLIENFGKLRAPHHELLLNLSDKDIFWRQVLPLVNRIRLEKNIARLHQLITALGAYEFSWDADVPEYLRNELISMFVLHSSEYCAYDLAMILRSLSGMKTTFHDLSQHPSFSTAFEKALQTALSYPNVQSLSVIYQGMSKMGFKWKNLSTSQRNSLTCDGVDMTTCKSLQMDSFFLSIIFHSLVSMEASWDSLSPKFQDFLWRELQHSFFVGKNPATFSLLLWSLGEMGWHWDHLMQDTLSPGNAASQKTKEQQVLERILQVLETANNLRNVCQILKALVELQCPVSRDSLTKQVWFKIWKCLNTILARETWNESSSGIVLRSIPLLFFDVPKDVYMEHETEHLAALLDKVLAQASAARSESKANIPAWNVQVTIMMLFLNYGIPHDSKVRTDLLSKYPMFQLHKESYLKYSNSWVLRSSQKSLEQKWANSSSLPTSQLFIARNLQKRLPDNYKLLHEYSGLGDFFPVDIAIIKFEKTTSSAGESTRRLVGFLEVDGHYHYHAQITRGHRTAEEEQPPRQWQFRRLDKFKEFMYRRQFPDVSMFARIPMVEPERLDTLLDQIARQITEIN